MHLPQVLQLLVLRGGCCCYCCCRLGCWERRLLLLEEEQPRRHHRPWQFAVAVARAAAVAQEGLAWLALPLLGLQVQLLASSPKDWRLEQLLLWVTVEGQQQQH